MSQTQSGEMRLNVERLHTAGRMVVSSISTVQGPSTPTSGRELLRVRGCSQNVMDIMGIVSSWGLADLPILFQKAEQQDNNANVVEKEAQIP
jgi:hypothetical protein